MIFSGFGHKPDELGGYSKDVLAKLIAFAVETIPQFGATKIISGLSLGFEQAIAMAAIELELPLIVALPFEGQETVWPEKSQVFYHTLLNQATEIKLVSPGRYDVKKFQERDRWIIDNCEAVFVLYKDLKEEYDIDFPVDEISSCTAGKIIELIAKRRNKKWLTNRILEYAENKERHIYQLWPLWEEWDGDLQFENFRDSLMNMSLDEG